MLPQLLLAGVRCQKPFTEMQNASVDIIVKNYSNVVVNSKTYVFMMVSSFVLYKCSCYSLILNFFNNVDNGLRLILPKLIRSNSQLG